MRPHHFSIAQAFDRAESYHHKAQAQQRISNALFQRLKGQSVPDKGAKILEIGCGTGFLSQSLKQRWPEALLLFSDLSPTMVTRCLKNLSPTRSTHFLVMDGSYPAVKNIDLIISSMTFQWFTNLSEALNRLYDALAPGSQLIFAMPGMGTFQKWRHLCKKFNIPCGLQHFPDAKVFPEMLPQAKCHIEEAFFPIHYPSLQHFLKNLKETGAHTPHLDHYPASTGALRAVMRHNGSRDGFKDHYHILFVSYHA
ncbi:methyltransferase domain-containing protein [Magnetococcales bacterium HHB-1]